MTSLARASSYVLFTCLLGVLAFIAGCNPPGVPTIVSPTNGSVHNTPPVIELAYQSRPAAVSLNSTNITRFFQFSAGSATADTAEFESYLRQGSNRLRVGTAATAPFVDFIYNSEGPKVVIEKVEGSQPIRLIGYLDDPSGPATLTINGTNVQLGTGGRFDTMVADAAQYVFVATDTSGLSSETIFAAPGTSFNRIITTRVSQQAMNFVAEEVGPLLSNVDMSAILPDVNRELKEALEEDLTLIAVFADVEITGLDLAGVNAQLDIKPNASRGVIGFDADVYDVVADVDVHTILGITLPVTAKIAYANATGNAEVYAQASKLAVDLTGLNLQTQDLIVNLFGYDTVIISALANLLMPALEGVISTFVNGIMEEVVDQKLQEVGDEAIVDINGYQMGMKPLFQGFSSDSDSLHVVLGGAIYAKTIDIGVPQVLGSLYTTDSLPNATTSGSQIYANVSTNMINQALMASYQTGLNHFAFIDKNELQIGSVRDDEVGVTGTERILIDPVSPAFFKVDNVLGDPVLTIGLNGMGMRYQKKHSSGVYRDLFETKLDVEARVLLGVNDDDTLRIEFAGAPDVTLKDTVILDTIQVNQQLIKNVTNLIMPVIMPEIAKATQSIEIPKLAGYQLTIDDFSAVGEEHHHLGVGITISNANSSIVCAAGQDKYAGKCYEQCDEGYTGVGALCWMPPQKTYGRGVGTVPALSCGAEELDAGLCYEHCQSGYDGVGPVCWAERISYGRGAGSALESWCANGMEEDAGLCYTPCREGFNGVGPVCWNFPQSYGRGVGVPMTFGCNANEEQDGALCYPKCETDYNGVGPVCWYTKAHSYGRGVGTPASQQCGSNEELDAGLCYRKCDVGYNGVGPVCWPDDRLQPYTRTAVLP